MGFTTGKVARACSGIKAGKYRLKRNRPLCSVCQNHEWNNKPVGRTGITQQVEFAGIFSGLTGFFLLSDTLSWLCLNTFCTIGRLALCAAAQGEEIIEKENVEKCT